MSIKRRKPAVAGTFYPADANQLRNMVQEYLMNAPGRGPVPKAIIAPHAGYIYSGPVAAAAYACLAPARNSVKTVALIGPAHRHSFHGLALSGADIFETPLGDVPVNRVLCDQLMRFSQVTEMDEAHEHEHCLEVHLPFLQYILDDFSIVPILTGQTEEDTLAEVMEFLYDREGCILLISSDLSHYLSYEEAVKLDETTSDAILALDAERIQLQQACGRMPITGMLRIAKTHQLKAHVLELKNSGDTAGPRDQVVGYGSYAFTA